jgi:hypothetical protein
MYVMSELHYSIRRMSVYNVCMYVMHVTVQPINIYVIIYAHSLASVMQICKFVLLGVCLYIIQKLLEDLNRTGNMSF